MAQRISVQSGNWNEPSTWDGGTVPNTQTDDVVVDAGHEVVIPDGVYVLLGSNNLLALVAGGTLRIQGGLEIEFSNVVVLGNLVVDSGGSLMALEGGQVYVESTGTLTVNDECYFSWDSVVTIAGQFVTESSGHTSFYGYASLEVIAGGVFQTYGACEVERRCFVSVAGDFGVETGGSFSVADNSLITIANEGALFVYGLMSTVGSNRVELLGYFGLDTDGTLNVSTSGLINAYGDIHISGRMTGGGKIIMFRREGRILDFNGNSLFVFDQAYGFGLTRIA